MEEVLLTSLDPRLKKQVDHAELAIDQDNAPYAISVCMNILKRHPGCVEVRRVLRKAQVRSTGGPGGKIKMFQKLTRAPLRMTGPRKARKDPEAALVAAEEMLARDPGNTAAHLMLGEAAENLGLWRTAALSYESVIAAEAGNLAALKRLARALIRVGEQQKAIAVAEGILEKAPGDEEGLSLVKQASVSHSIAAGGWDREGGFRDKLSDEKQARELERAGRAEIDAEDLGERIRKAEAAVASSPEDLKPYKDLAGYHRKLEQPGAALEWIRRARRIPAGRADNSLERLEQALEREVVVHRVRTLEEKRKAAPGRPALSAELECARRELRVMRRRHAQAMAERYPNDGLYRYELGVLLLEDSAVDAAIGHLQAAVKSPGVRVQALAALGRAYLAKGFFDLAIEPLEAAKAEVPGMDDLKKEILYTLAGAREEAGDHEKAIAEYKLIYSADIGYRDVAAKVDAYYSQRGAKSDL